jgi:hypothetical protein
MASNERFMINPIREAVTRIAHLEEHRRVPIRRSGSNPNSGSGLHIRKD